MVNQPRVAPQSVEAPAPKRRGRKKKAPSKEDSSASLLEVLPGVVTVTNAQGEILELPLPESTVPKAWIPASSVIEVF